MELLCHDSSNSVEMIDRRLDALEAAYLDGVRSTGELSRRAGVSRVALRRNYMPALEARLARRAAPASRKAALAKARGRVEDMMRQAWHTMLSADKAGVRAHLGFLIRDCTRELAKLDGISERDDEHQRLLAAISSLLRATSALVEETGDRALMQAFESVLEKFTVDGAAPQAQLLQVKDSEI